MNQIFRILLFTLSFALITFSGCQSYYQAKQTKNLSRPINPEVAIDASPTAKMVAATIEPYQSQLSEKMDEVIARVSQTLEKDRPESRLGNWTAELIQQAAVDLFPDLKIDFSVQNYGGLRIRALAAGPVTVRNIYELMPFDNELVAVELNGFVLQEFIDHMAADGGWPVSGGLRYRIEDDKGVDVTIAGVPIAFNRNYVIALPDYVANGGSGSKMLIDRQHYQSGTRIRDLLIEHVRKIEGPISVKLDARVTKG